MPTNLQISRKRLNRSKNIPKSFLGELVFLKHPVYGVFRSPLFTLFSIQYIFRTCVLCVCFSVCKKCACFRACFQREPSVLICLCSLESFYLRTLEMSVNRHRPIKLIQEYLPSPRRMLGLYAIVVCILPFCMCTRLLQK